MLWRILSAEVASTPFTLAYSRRLCLRYVPANQPTRQASFHETGALRSATLDTRDETAVNGAYWITTAKGAAQNVGHLHQKLCTTIIHIWEPSEYLALESYQAAQDRCTAPDDENEWQQPAKWWNITCDERTDIPLFNISRSRHKQPGNGQKAPTDRTHLITWQLTTIR